MSYILHDPDQWETIFTSTPNSAGMSMRQRDPSEVLKIKEAKRLQQEENILAQAADIQARRALPKRH